MKKSMIVLAVAACTMAAAFAGVAQTQKSKKVVYASSEKATFKPIHGEGGPSMDVLRGDPDKGPHATFTKFAPGYDAGWHTHTNDVSCVVIKGAIFTRMMPAKNVSGQANISSSPAATNIG